MQEQQIPESKKFYNEKSDKEHHINMQMIAETSFDSTFNGTEEQKIQVLLKLKSIHLEWLNIKHIQNLQVFQDLNILYLQHNLISKIQGLDHLKNLEYLALNDNRITVLEGVKELSKLQGLNLTNNLIQQINPDQLPENIQLLSFKNNPVSLDIDYKQIIIKRLKALETLDDITITPVERFKILGIFPEKLGDYASRMRQFYTKRQVQTRISQQGKPVLFNTEPFNQKDATNQIRAKYRKYQFQNQQSFKEGQKQQINNFNQKIEVSRKIRQIKTNQEQQRQKRLQEIKKSTMTELMNAYDRK